MLLRRLALCALLLAMADHDRQWRSCRKKAPHAKRRTATSRVAKQFRKGSAIGANGMEGKGREGGVGERGREGGRQGGRQGGREEGGGRGETKDCIEDRK